MTVKFIITCQSIKTFLKQFNFILTNFQSQALDLLNIFINFLSRSNVLYVKGIARRHLEFIPKALGQLQFQRKVQLNYVLTILTASDGSLNVQSLTSSWQTAYKIHWLTIINRERSSTASLLSSGRSIQ
jgi:hypothetical protein